MPSQLPILDVQNLTKSFGAHLLFNDISFSIAEGQKVGLIARNGTGKSTLLSILTGVEGYDSGKIIFRNDIRIGYLEQTPKFNPADTVLEACFNSNDSEERILKAKQILTQLKIGDLNQTMGTLSGGQQRRVALANVLATEPDMFVLDEPTNNLDLPSIAWLEENLKRHEGTMVVISHDRHFLNSVCTHILDMDFGGVREFSGNYDDWYIASTLIAKQQEAERNKKLKEKEELENFIRRFSANASKAKQATSRQKQLDKLDIQNLAVSSRRDPSIVFKPNRTIGNEALECENISKSYGDKKVLENLSLKILPGDKIALIGANGVGKSTFMQILVEELQADSGVVKWGATIERSYFPQNVSEEIKGEESLYEWLRGFDKKKESGEIRNALGRMLFSGEEQEKSINALSGGEKHRMVLSKIMLEGGNFLVLDEPTNHLDLESIIALGEALYRFSGNVICVSHDRELIDAYANRIIELVAVENGAAKVIDFRGSYEEYLESKGV